MQLSNLPPTRSAAHQHLNRTYFQIQKWLGQDLNPLDWGWKLKNESLEPITTTSKPAPDELLDSIFCNCKNGCGPRCGCRKSGLKCSLACGHCNGQACFNTEYVDLEEINSFGAEVIEAEVEERCDENNDIDFLEPPESDDDEKM